MELARILFDSLSAYMQAHGPSQKALEQADSYEDALAMQHRAQERWAMQPLDALDRATPAQYLAEQASPEEWRRLVIDWAALAQQGDEPLPKPFRRAVGARLDELGPHLAPLIGDEALWGSNAPGKGYAPALAAGLFGELRNAAAVPPLLKVLERTEEFTMLGDMAVAALTAIGGPAREGLYDLAECHKGDVQSIPYTRAVEILTRLPKDDRTWQYLRQGLQAAREMVDFYAVLAGDYGDLRAVFHLNALLENRGDLTASGRQDCLSAIEQLGGIATAKARTAAGAGCPPNPDSGRVGRNDPCPCGSGKKYKKCCGQ